MKEDFFKFLKFQKRYSQHTVIAYKTDIDQFAAHLFKNDAHNAIDNVNKHDIRSWVVSMSTLEMHPKSINRKIISLRSYYKWQQNQGLRTDNPASQVPLLKTPKSLPQIVLADEIKSKLAQDLDGLDFKRVRDLSIIELLYGCGLRQQELISLKVNDLDLDQNQIKVMGKRSKERRIPIPSATTVTLKYYLRLKKQEFLDINVNQPANPLLVTDKGKVLYPMFVDRTVKKFMSDIPFLKKRSPHILRHSYATHLLEEGAELAAVKDLLGHASLASTQVYTHNSLERIKSVYKKAHPKS